MTDSIDVQAVKKISTEVGDSQLNIVLSTQCIKGQCNLLNKLQNESNQQKQICNFISNGNLKLETEIRLAEQKVKILLVALEIIKGANVELRKELLLAKERTIATTERVNSGIKKNEQLWLTSKQRYENIPYIKKYLQTINEKDTVDDNISKLAEDKQKLLNDINKKKYELLCLDRKNIIELARYMIHEKPVILKNININQDELNKLIKNIQGVAYSNESATILKEDLTVYKNASNATKTIQDPWLNMSKTLVNVTIAVPKSQLLSVDLDFFSNKLDKIRKNDSQNIYTKKVHSEALHIQPKNIKTEDMIKDIYVSSYFSKINEKSVDLKPIFSDKKLIHILQDKKLDKTETFEIIAKVNGNALQIVDKIGENVQEKIICSDQNENSGENQEKIEEIDYTNTPTTSYVLVPPSQFLDYSQNECINSQGQIDAEEKIIKNSQEKKVTLNEIISVKSTDIIDLEKAMDEDDNNQFDVNDTSENYKKIKEIVFKKHNLDLSPQFTYSKNSVASVQSENVVKSISFDENNKIQSMDVDEIPANVNVVESSQKITDDEIPPENINESKDDQKDTSMSGFLFTHGALGIVDSLNMSISTLGYEDSDLPHCIDSSLLLSPKADDHMPTTSGNAQVLSQEVPNFLSGLKKTGLSFFGNQQSEDKPTTTTQTQNNNFTFAFGREGKKPRGGFFSMFH